MKIQSVSTEIQSCLYNISSSCAGYVKIKSEEEKTHPDLPTSSCQIVKGKRKA